jgi:hypothetical protein
MSSRFRRPSPATVIAIAALVVATSGVAIGSFAPKNSKIVACSSKQTGALRLVKEGKKCRKGEQKIAWNQQGKRGLRGPRGARGRAGDDGFDGLDGFDGFDGADGADAASMLTGSFTATPGTEPVFAAPSGRDAAGADEPEHATLSPATDIVASDLAVALDPLPPVPENAEFTVTLRRDGEPTTVSCKITGAPWSCASGTITATLAAGSTLTLEVTSTVAGPERVFRFGWRATTP